MRQFETVRAGWYRQGLDGIWIHILRGRAGSWDVFVNEDQHGINRPRDIRSAGFASLAEAKQYVAETWRTN
jgi:hypothetical protein